MSNIVFNSLVSLRWDALQQSCFAPINTVLCSNTNLQRGNILKILICVFLATISMASMAEEVELNDGRKLLLKSDGTYEFLGALAKSSTSLLSVESHLFERHSDEYSRNSIRFMPIFKNESEKVITAVKFSTTFLDPFGESILKTGGSSEERIRPGKKSKARLFYSFEDNQFIDGEAYDKLLSSAINETGSIKTDIDAIVFADGEVVKFGE